MYLIFIFAVLCLGAAAMSLVFNKKIEETLSLWIFFIIFILYFSGICYSLKKGMNVIIAITVISLIFCFYSIFKDKKKFIGNILTPGFSMFIVFFALAWWAQRGRMLSHWDEFSHWGIVVKNMYIFNALSNHAESTVIFKSYPPATALLEYFFVKLSKNFTEGNLYRAMNILYFSLMMPIFKNVKWKDFSKILTRFVLILILPLAFFQDFYCSILVDALLGVIFSGILINYYVNKMCMFKITYISLGLFTLIITKASGFGLAIIAIMIIGTDLLFVKRRSLILYLKGNKISDKFKRILLLICPIFFTAFAKYSWCVYLRITKTDASWDTKKITIQGIKNLFNSSAPHYQITTVKNFITYLSEHFITQYTISISYIGWIVLLLAISIVLINYICNEEEKKQYKVATTAIFMGAALYSLSLLILYVFIFSINEATNLASYSRYMSTYLLGILVFFVTVICLKEQTQKNKYKTSFPVLILLSLLLIVKVTPIIDITILAPHNIKNTISFRQKFAPITRIKQTLDPKNAKVYIVSTASNGFDYWVCKYNITPIKANSPGTWSIGKPYYKGDIWTIDMNEKEWETKLKSQFNYVYILKSNELFRENYGMAFRGGGKSIKNNTLYFRNIRDGKVILTMVM